MSRLLADRKYSRLPILLLSPQLGLAGLVLAASVLAAPLAAQTKASQSGLYVTGSQPYNLSCSVAGPAIGGVAGPTGTVSFTDVTAGNSLGSASLGAPSGGYTLPQQVWSTGLYSNVLATGDFNADGNLDLVVGANASASVSVLLGNGDGTFRPQVVSDFSSQLPYEPVLGIAVGDFDGDKFPDLILLLSKSLYFSKGNGDGSFQVPVAINMGGLGATAIVAGDFRGIGKLDLAFTVVNASSQSVAVMLGNGRRLGSRGELEPRIIFPIVDSPVVLATSCAVEPVEVRTMGEDLSIRNHHRKGVSSGDQLRCNS